MPWMQGFQPHPLQQPQPVVKLEPVKVEQPVKVEKLTARSSPKLCKPEVEAKRMPHPVKKEVVLKCNPKLMPVKLEPPPGLPLTRPPGPPDFRPFDDGDDDLLEEVPLEVPKIDVLASDEEDTHEEGLPLGVPNMNTTAAGAEASNVSMTTVNVFSIGWFQQGCQYAKSIDDQIEELSRRIKIRFSSVGEVQLFMDTKCFFQKPPGTGHVGFFDEDIRLFVHNKHFKPWLKEVKTCIEELESDAGKRNWQEVVNIVCVCRAGRNRSVAAKTVLNYIFSMAGFETNDKTGHLSKPGWANGRWPNCSECEGCLQMTPKKKQALTHAFYSWNTL